MGTGRGGDLRRYYPTALSHGVVPPRRGQVSCGSAAVARGRAPRERCAPARLFHCGPPRSSLRPMTPRVNGACHWCTDRVMGHVQSTDNTSCGPGTKLALLVARIRGQSARRGFALYARRLVPSLPLPTCRCAPLQYGGVGSPPSRHRRTPIWVDAFAKLRSWESSLQRPPTRRCRR